MAGIASLIIGAALIAFGILLIKFRRQITDFAKASEKATFGKVGQAASQRQTPAGTTLAGGLAVGGGVLGIIQGIVILLR